MPDPTANPGETAAVISSAPSGFEVYSGDDALTLSLLAVGAVGTIGVATHWAAPVVGEMIAAFHKGDVTRATELNARLLESYAGSVGNDEVDHSPPRHREPEGVSQDPGVGRGAFRLCEVRPDLVASIDLPQPGDCLLYTSDAADE